jgi:xylulokinase
VLPFFDGERTPNLPDAKGSLHGMTRASLTPENVTRAVVEGVIANLARGVDAIAQQTQPPSRLILIGGAAQNPGVQTVVAEQLAIPVSVPDSGEYVAYGAAKQAAWALTGQNPSWAAASITLETGDGAGIARAQFDRVLAEHPGLAD